MRLLHMIATPRSTRSTTLVISGALIENLKSQFEDLEIDELDVFTTALPELRGANVEAKYSLMARQELDAEAAAAWAPIESLVRRFLAADAYLVTVPMWNFGIPYALKHLLDVIVQPGYTFSYDERGVPVGLVGDRPMVCVTSRGGDYSTGMQQHAMDFQEPYLRAIFGFIGITRIDFVSAQPVDIPPLRERALADAMERARAIRWNAPQEGVDLRPDRAREAEPVIDLAAGSVDREPRLG